ncbi:MAG: hypothetical protein WCP28_16395 [Actinomycetes bacterium]
MTRPRRFWIAWALIIWSAVAILLAVTSAPVWVRLPVVGPFTLLAVGLAAVLVIGIRQPGLALAVAISVGLSSLILTSEIVLYAGTWSPLRALILQVVLVVSLSAASLVTGSRSESSP